MFQKAICNNIIKGFKAEIHSAVGIVFDSKNNLLLGKAITDDERNGKWVFPGGGVDKGESPLQAAIREVYEECGVSSTPVHLPMLIHPSKPSVSFFILRCTDDNIDLTPNEEFSEMKWFNLSKLPKQTLSLNLDMLKMIK